MSGFRAARFFGAAAKSLAELCAELTAALALLDNSDLQLSLAAIKCGLAKLKVILELNHLGGGPAPAPKASDSIESLDQLFEAAGLR